jgi:alkylated DNA repair dioxygenase AlkB
VAVVFQGSLFGAETPALGRLAPVRRLLNDGAWVDHQPEWLTGADAVFEELLESAPWSQHRRPMYDRMVDDPRLSAWWSEAEDGWDGLPTVVLEARDALTAHYGVTFDSVGCNLYRDGRDSVAWHGDTVRKTQATSVIAILSVGERRALLLRPTGGGPSIKWQLGRGDLFVMGGTCQHAWQHTIPKRAAAGPRISITFRRS